MPQRILTILQIGDVHLPDYQSSRIVNHKDKGFPQSVLNLIAPTRLQVVAKCLINLMETSRHKPAGIIISGDLTSRGNLKGYQDCVDYLCTVLQLNDSNKWIPDQIHVVPGNHDIDRANIDDKSDLYSKFIPLCESWQSKGLTVLANENRRHTQILKAGMRVDLFSINSCLGCGAKDYLPGAIREELTTLLKGAPFDVSAMQLDTPAFDSDVLNLIKDDIDSLTKTTLPIVSSHHNILSQAQPRIEIYTEAINGGLVRSMLSNLGRPVLYCHGHLHKDPIEIVVSPKAAKGRLVLIAAPLLSDGFNVIEVHFARSGMPIGCVVRPYRLGDEGVVKKDSPVRIPLLGHRDATRTSTDDALNVVLNEVNSQAKRFRQLHDKIQAGDVPERTDKELVGLLLELEWAGLVTITDRDEDHMHWQIYRNDP